MRNDACVKFKQLLNKYNLYQDFRSAIKQLGMKYCNYVTYVEALYAFRRIYNVYDDSELAKAAVEWEDIVVLNHYSKTVEKYVEAHGMQNVIKAIHELQRLDKWTVPKGIERMQRGKLGLMTSLSDAIESPVTPRLQLHTPKPTLPDTTPLPTPKPDNEMKPVNITLKEKAFAIFDSDDGQYDILDLTNNARGAKTALDNYHIKVVSYSANHRITFNQHITNLVRSNNAMYIHLRIDKVQSKAFIVFSVKELPGSIPCKFADEKKNNLYVNSKTLAVYLAKGRTEKRFLRHVSTNLSKRDDMLCFELFDD